MINCIYIHIPFCQKKCNYCSFCSFAGNSVLTKEKSIYIDSLIKEIKYFYDNSKIKTLYFGGGTPSLLDYKDFEKIINIFNFKNDSEITIEINPNTTDYSKLKAYKNMGINRISVGVQNFDNKILNAIGRNHTKEDIYQCINDIKNAEFKNFSIDLMYGLPNQTMEQWENTLNEAIKIRPQHISLYGLKIEEGTYFYKFPPKNLPNSDIQADMYELAIEKLKNNFLHYEFSSFAKNKSFISKHNSAYWKRKNYWGFGLSASGFIDNKRYTNTFNLKKYIKNPIEKKYTNLTKIEQIEEEVFLGLRMYNGIDFSKINKKFNINIFKKYQNIFEKYINTKHFEYTEKGIKFTKKGILVSNEILCEFLKD